MLSSVTQHHHWYQHSTQSGSFLSAINHCDQEFDKINVKVEVFIMVILRYGSQPGSISLFCDPA